MAHGAAVFAGVLMIVVGAFQAIEAFAAIVNDEYLVVLPNYVFALDLTVWGWIHLLLGLGLVAVGVFVLERRELGPRRRHFRGCGLRGPQLLLAALLPVVGAAHHRYRRTRDLGTRVVSSCARKPVDAADAAAGAIQASASGIPGRFALDLVRPRTPDDDERSLRDSVANGEVRRGHRPRAFHPQGVVPSRDRWRNVGQWARRA